VRIGGDFARDASSASGEICILKKGSIPRAVAMPRSFCIHRTLPHSGPLDGARRCLLEGSASGPPPPTVSPPGSSRSSFPARWCCRSCLLLATVGGARPHGGWRSSAIARLQGFSSCNLAATSRQWSSTRMITSLVVERSEPGCSLPPALSFKDVHHPRWGGKRAELGSCLPRGLVTRFFLQHSGGRASISLAEEANFGYTGPTDCRHRQLPCVRLLGLDGFGAASDAASCRLVGVWLSVHRMGDGRAVRRFATSVASPTPPAAPFRRRTGGSYKMSYAAGVAAAFLDGLVLTPIGGREQGPLRAR
jgi:hypothetical protein